MTNDRISEIEETLGLPDPVVKDSKIMCLQARDARHLLGLVRRQQEVVGIVERVSGHQLDCVKCGDCTDLGLLIDRLRYALDRLNQAPDPDA